MAHILAVDDDPDLCTLLKTALERDGHAVEIRTSGVTVTESLCRWADCILLDVMMPGEDGFATCRRIRAITQAPILFLTARTDEQSVLTGLGIGADDYLTKPFRVAELRARVAAHLRRQNRAPASRMVRGGIGFDLAAKTAMVGEQPLPFTRSEYAISEYLALHAGQTFSKEQIYEAVFGYDGTADDTAVTQHIKNIRAKLRTAGVAAPETVLKTIWGILFPFVLGGAIAFVINVPMSFLEKKIFGKTKDGNKVGKKLARPISLLLTIILAVGVIALVMFGVIPQLTRTMGSLMISIANFVPQMQNWIRDFSHNNQEIMKLVNQVQFNQDQAIKWGISILGSGAGNMMNTTMSAVGSIVSGFATFFIAFSFACYILFQKEKLHVQIRKVFFAFISKQKAEVFLKICSLTYQTFANFLTGQRVEAVILGSMFVVTLSILKMPYALLIGTLIAFTALIPIFGAFIGCAVGCFLIFMVSPKQAILFIIVFLILQQIEGNLIYPHVVGGSVGLPSIWVLAAVTIGGNLMGIVGMLIFIPLVSVLYTIFREFVYLRLKEKNIKQVTKTVVEEYTAEEIAAMEKNIKKNRE